MATTQQLAANSANAQASTGPRTEEGKARVSQNARKHGFTAQTLHVAPADKDAFDTLFSGLLDDVHPEGALENELFRRLAAHAWNLRRIEDFESQVLSITDPISDDSSLAKLERIARYRRDVERGFYRALAELRKLQTQRAALLQQDPIVVDAFNATAPLAELTRLTKQTDSFIRQPIDGPSPATRSLPPAAGVRPRRYGPGI